jgi:hypothetical protein
VYCIGDLDDFAWFGFAPLFLLIYANNSYFKQIMLAGAFGLAYNLVYLHWYLNLAPLDWLGFSGIFGHLLAILAWLSVAIHQALAFVLFAALVSRLPLSGSFTAKRGPRKVWFRLFIQIIRKGEALQSGYLISHRVGTGNITDCMEQPSR